jgi:hypothetical protein
MAVTIEASYSKKIGLPAYSSHSYSVTIRSEVADLNQVERESTKLYSLLQGAVDREIVESGYVPDPIGNGNGSTTSRTTNGHASQSNGDQWSCSAKQRELILKIVEEHKLDKQEVENLSKQMFNQPVKSLNKMDASSLIAELISKYGPTKSNGGSGNGNGRRQYQRGGAR